MCRNKVLGYTDTPKVDKYIILDFPADIGKKPGNVYTPARAGNTYTPANEAADGASWRRA